MIQIKGLHKYFNKGRQNEIHVINDVTLDLPERGMVAVFGKSGCGKTTLLNVIGGLDGFASGSLTVEGRDIRRDTDELRNRYIGYIFQNYNLNKQETCFENVADALRLCGVEDEETVQARVTAALTNVGMEKYAKRTPDTLSGGQQQRVAIARAIVKNPRIILADEPTGNLDEANTVMIMDLLKAISRDHLVLLVTHEANLVDYYCDTVIELSDGRVANLRQNSHANGFAARDKNDIYLGELQHSRHADGNTAVDYYGEAPESPVRLTVVNNGGKLYVQINSERVQILDEFSEVKLRKGVYREQEKSGEGQTGIDMSALPPVEGERMGRLFTFASSVKSGYVANFRRRKKSKKLLRGCMCLFAAVIVFMSSVFGGSISDVLDARAANSRNVFYLKTDAEVSARLAGAVGSEESGIDFIRLMSAIPSGDPWAFFRAASFETFVQTDYESNFKANAAYLDLSVAKDLPLVAGTRENLAMEEILVSTALADALLEKSTLGYISEYRDLIGLVSTMYTVDGKNPRIAGVVESRERAIYMGEFAMAKYTLSGGRLLRISAARDFGAQLAEGETVLVQRQVIDGVKFPKVGEKIMISGREVTVKEIWKAEYDYAAWLEAKGIKKQSEQAYYDAIMAEKFPGMTEKDAAYFTHMAEIENTYCYEYQAYFYAELGDYCRELYLFEPNNLYLWMYVEKGIEQAAYSYLPYDVGVAFVWREQQGTFPTLQDVEDNKDGLQDTESYLKEYVYEYEEEFYRKSHLSIDAYGYLLSDADYIGISKQTGETHESAKVLMGYYPDYKYEPVEEGAVTVSPKASSSVVEIETVDGDELLYTLIHSKDPAKTEAWLRQSFPEQADARSGLYVPDDFMLILLSRKSDEIIANLISMGVMLVLMCICMYFIMRSSLMNRIKEVGIYRAIGVSKKNLVFKFFIEAAVLTALTVFVGYLVTSSFIWLCLGMSSAVAEFFFYPPWLSLGVLALLAGAGLFFGILPILSLLRKTPSEILAKYDI